MHGGITIQSALTDLIIMYFRQKGYQIQEGALLEGLSGLPHKFPLLIKKGNEKHLVTVLDWKRTVGVNMVIRLDMASSDVGFSNPVLVSNNFSSHAKAYANRRGMTLLTKHEITRRLG